MKKETSISRGLAKADRYHRGNAHILFQNVFLDLDELGRFHEGANPVGVVIYDRLPSHNRKSKLTVRKKLITKEHYCPIKNPVKIAVWSYRLTRFL